MNRIFVKTVDGQEVDESEIPPGEANTEMNVWIQSGEANHNAAEVVASLRQLRGRDSSAAAEAFVALMQRVTEGTPAQTYEAIAHGGIVTQAIASALESLRL